MKYYAGFFMIITLGLALLYSAETQSQDIPDQYKNHIVQLRSDVVAQAKKCADLQKQIAEMQANMQWDAAQIEIVSNEALTAMRLSNKEFHIDIDKLKVVPVKK